MSETNYKELATKQIPWNKGLKGAQVAWNKGLKGFFNSGTFKKGHKNWDNPKVKEHWIKKGVALPLRWKQAMKGRTPWNKNLRGYNAQEKHPNWQGGITPIRVKIRNSIQGRLWREAVFARDNWTCQQCKKHGGDLNAHHIQQFAYYPELRFAIDNGITLCVPCHKKITWKK